MSKREEKVRVTEQSPLKWAEGWNRLPIGDRKQMKAWKKPFVYYKEALVQQLARLGANEIMISFNTGDDARRSTRQLTNSDRPDCSRATRRIR